MNLTDLQVELRDMEEHLAILHHEIDKMKPKSEDEKRADFGAIDKLATKNVILNGVISGMPDERRKAFFKSLSYLLLSAEKDIYARLLYLSRLSLGSGLNWKSEELYKSGLEIEDVDDIVKGLEEYKHTFLVEAFVVSGITGSVNEKALSIIADVAKLMGCDQEELRVIAQVAKSRLMDDMDKLLEIPVPTKNRWMSQFRDYITYEWIEKNRVHCGELCIKKYHSNLGDMNNIAIPAFLSVTRSSYDSDKSSSPCVIKRRCQAGSIVKRGDVICTYKEKIKVKKKPNDNTNHSALFRELDIVTEEEVDKEIKSPCDGIVFFINDNRKGKENLYEYVVAYVISYFDDYNEFEQWFKNNRKGA